MTRPTTPANQEGPSEAPPSLPEGWLAQWEGQSRKYYYVQRATGHSQWAIPTQPAPSVPTPDPTPQPVTHPFQQPPMPGDPKAESDGAGGARGIAGPGEEYEGADRGFLTDLATSAMGGKQNKPQNQSGLGGFAQSFLGGQGPHSGSGGHGGSGGLAGQLVGGLLGGNKPHNQQSAGQAPGSFGGYGGSSGGHGQSGLMGMASGFLGGHHGSNNSSNNYGYSSTGQHSSGYSGEAPPVAYQPPGQQSTVQHSTPGGYNSTSSSAGQSHQDSSPYGPSSQGPSYGHSNPTSYESFGQQHNQQQPPSFSGPPSAPYDTAASHTPYGQQTPSYPPQQQPSGYEQYQSHGQQGHYPPPPHNTPAYPGQQPGGYDSYGPPPPPMSSHPNQQGGQYGGQPSSGGYPGQPSFGAPPDQGYGHQQPQYSPYGQQQQYGSGAPPAPGWRA